MLDKFRETAITWDKASRKVYEPLRASAGDNKGRKLSVQVVNGGVVENLSGASLSLFWETKDKAHKGLDTFTAVSAVKGEFEIYYTTGMLSNEGTLNANLVLVDTSGRIVSEPFTITVFKGIDDDAIQSEDSFTALTQALIDISNLEQNYAQRLNDLTAQLQHTATKSEVDQKLQQVADGAPKISALSLTELENDYPNGSTENAVVVEKADGTIDGHIYTWNGTAWGSTGILYQAMGIPKQSVKTEKIYGTVVGKNLYNPEGGTDDIYINFDTNTIIGGTAYNTSNPIPVIVGQTYTMTRARSIGHVDESGVLVSSQASHPNGSTTFVASHPFVRVSVVKESMSSAQLEASSTFTGFVPFKYEIPDDMLSYKGVSGEKIKDDTLEATKFKGHVAGKNKFDKATVASGYLDPSTYQVTPSTAYKYTQDFIDLVEGETYTINNSRSVVFYDASENPKRGINNGYQTPITFTAEHPKMKVSMANANVDTLQVERGTEVTEYKPYKPVIPLSAIESFEIGNGGGEAYDQSLNTTDDVSFNSVTTQTVNTDVLNTSGEIPTGTLENTPTGLKSGDVWADTTDSATHPILRVML